MKNYNRLKSNRPTDPSADEGSIRYVRRVEDVDNHTFNTSITNSASTPPLSASDDMFLSVRGDYDLSRPAPCQ